MMVVTDAIYYSCKNSFIDVGKTKLGLHWHPSNENQMMNKLMGNLHQYNQMFRRVLKSN